MVPFSSSRILLSHSYFCILIKMFISSLLLYDRASDHASLISLGKITSSALGFPQSAQKHNLGDSLNFPLTTLHKTLFNPACIHDIRLRNSALAITFAFIFQSQLWVSDHFRLVFCCEAKEIESLRQSLTQSFNS